MSKNLAALYTTEIHHQLTHMATWRPTERLELGDLGVMEGDRFARRSTLQAEVGVSPGDVREGNQGSLSYRSNGAVEVIVGGGGKMADPGALLAKGGADIEVVFAKENAILLDMVGCTARQLEDQLALGSKILELWAENEWDPEWAVVTEVVEADSTTVLMSAGNKAAVSLKANAALEITEAISLADARLRLQRVRSSGIGFEALAARGATPLIRALRLQKAWWKRKPKIIEGLEAMETGEPLASGEEPIPYFDLLGYE